MTSVENFPITIDDVQYGVVGFNGVQRGEIGLLERLHHAEFAGELYYVGTMEIVEADCSGFLEDGVSYVHYSVVDSNGVERELDQLESIYILPILMSLELKMLEMLKECSV